MSNDGLTPQERQLIAVSDHITRLQRERDELLAALKELVPDPHSLENLTPGHASARALIARLEKTDV